MSNSTSKKMYTICKNTSEQSFSIKSLCDVQVQGDCLLKWKAFQCIGFSAHKNLPMNSSISRVPSFL